MEAWRRVEVAACEEMPGPTPDDLEAIRAATFTVEAVKEREPVTDHDVAAFVDVLQRERRPVRALDPLRPDLVATCSTRRSRCRSRAAGEIVVAGARELVAALAERAREHVDTVCVGRTHGVHAEPTTFGIKLAGFAFEAAAQRRSGSSAPSPRRRSARSRGAVGTYAATVARLRGARPRAARARAPSRSRPRSSPRDRHAELLQAIALAGAGLERLATEIRHLQRTEVREAEEPFRSGQQKGSSAMPHKRNPIVDRAHLRPRAGAARQRPGRRRERRAVARARHLPLRRRARDPARLDDPARLHAAPRDARRARHGRPPRPHAREPRPHPRRAVLPARPARARRAGPQPRRGLPDRAGGRPARVGQRASAARAAGRARPRARPRRDLRPRRTTRGTPSASSGASTRSRTWRPRRPDANSPGTGRTRPRQAAKPSVRDCETPKPVESHAERQVALPDELSTRPPRPARAAGSSPRSSSSR